MHFILRYFRREPTSPQPLLLARDLSARQKRQMAPSVIKEWRSKEERRGSKHDYVETFLAHSLKKNRRHSKMLKHLPKDFA